MIDVQSMSSFGLFLVFHAVDCVEANKLSVSSQYPGAALNAQRHTGGEVDGMGSGKSYKTVLRVHVL